MTRSSRADDWVQGCVALIVWLTVITFAGFTVEPGLSRISYPQIPDLAVLLLIPAAAFHTGRHCLPGWVYLAFGAAGSMYFVSGLCFMRRVAFNLDRASVGATLAVVCSFAVLCGLTARWAARQRPIWDARRRFPQGHCQNCGYNLTGNVSGRCPECGRTVGEHGRMTRRLPKDC